MVQHQLYATMPKYDPFGGEASAIGWYANVNFSGRVDSEFSDFCWCVKKKSALLHDLRYVYYADLGFVYGFREYVLGGGEILDCIRWPSWWSWDRVPVDWQKCLFSFLEYFFTSTEGRRGNVFAFSHLHPFCHPFSGSDCPDSYWVNIVRLVELFSSEADWEAASGKCALHLVLLCGN